MQSLFFTLFKRTPKIEGSLGYFGLDEWWLATFTENERKYIEVTFKPLGDNPRSLTQGRILETAQTASNLLSCLAGWFEKAEDVSIGKRIIEKAIEIAGSKILDRHFAYGQMITNYYHAPGGDSTALELTKFACKKQIILAPQAAKAFRKEISFQELPEHKGYERLVMILEKEKNYDEAIQLCNQAKEQGWQGDWENRIARYVQKRNKSTR